MPRSIQHPVKGRASTDTHLSHDMEQVIASLRNVLSARVVLAGNSIEEIHVLADTGRPAKWIVRDVETALTAKFGVVIDHRKVSVAQLDTPASRPILERPVLTALRVELTTTTSVVTVELMWGSQSISGVAEGLRSEQVRSRLAAEATLSAVSHILKDGVALSLDHIDTVTVGERQVMLVSVGVSGRGGQERLLGSALIGSDHLEPAVKASLDALNRRLGHIAARE